MKNEWGMCRISGICEKTKNVKWQDEKETKKYIDLSSVSRDTLAVTAHQIVNSQNAPSRAKKVIIANDVIFATTRPTLKRVAIIDENYDNALCSTGFTVLRPQISKINARWLFHIFTTEHFMQYIEKLQKGASYPAVTDNDVKAYRIPVPPLPEQKRIVRILDEAFAAIDKAKENAEKNLANSRELFESYLNGIFANPGKDWESDVLSELGTITSSKRIYKNEYVNGGVPFYRTKEIKELANNLDISLELFISRERYAEIRSKFGVPQINDILLTAIGTIGEIWVIDNDTPFYFKDGNVLWFKEFKSINPQYLRYVLLAFVDNLKKLSHGAAYNALPIEKLKKHRIFFPSTTKKQKEIVMELDKVREYSAKLVSVYSSKIADLEKLKKTILQKAFAGKL